MFFTGFTRFSSEVQKQNAMGKEDKVVQLREMLSLVDDARTGFDRQKYGFG